VTPGAVLTRRGLYILPTWHGWLFGLLLLVLFIAAVNYGNGLVYGLTFLLAAIAVVSAVHTHANLHGLRVSAGAAAPVFAGAPARFPLTLVDDGARARYGVVVTIAGREVARLDELPAQGAATVEIALPSARRGRLRLPPVTITTRYPLGLLYSWSRRLELGARALVYPAPAGEAPLTAARGGEGTGEGRPAGEGDDFVGQREYRRGDSLRHVNWKALAREGVWLTKEFGGAGGSVLWLDWEDLPGLAAEARLSALCRGVLEAERAGGAYGLRLPGTALAPASGEAHQARCLEALALWRG
jgi:uncharacterized protein (DUF58 family)